MTLVTFQEEESSSSSSSRSNGEETSRSTSRSNVFAEFGRQLPMPGHACSVKDYFTMQAQPIKQRFGKRVRNQLRQNSYEEWDFLKAQPRPQWEPVGGLSETKFSKGFHRRHASKMENYDQINGRTKEYEYFTPTTSRTESLMAKANTHGYDIISGERPVTRGPSKGGNNNFSSHATERKTGKKFFPDYKTRGDASNKADVHFFTERPRTVNSMARSRLLANDGLTLSTKRYQILQGSHHGELPSHGVADNFAHSHAMEQLKKCKSQGQLGKMFYGSK